MAKAFEMEVPESEGVTMKAEIDAMLQQFPAMLAEIQRDREEGVRWIERSRQRRQRTRAILADIDNILGRSTTA